MSEELFFASRVHGLEIHAFVLMPNHFHLLARSPTVDLGKPMHHFMR